MESSITSARQKLPAEKKCHSLKRNKILAAHKKVLERKPSRKLVQSLLSLPNIRIEKKPSHATLAQLVADCRKGEIYVRKWRDDRWQRYKV